MLLNGATSTVGALLLQLGRLLRLRPVAVARPPQPSANNGSSNSSGSSSKKAEDRAGDGVEGGEVAWERTVARLKALGAVEVLRDEGSLKVGAGGGSGAGRGRRGGLDRRLWVGGIGVGAWGLGGRGAACVLSGAFSRSKVPCCTTARLPHPNGRSVADYPAR